MFYFKNIFLHWKSMKIIQNTLKLQKKISNVSKKIWVGPKKVGSVGFPETRHFLGGPYMYM